MNKDWKGNNKSVSSMLGTTNYNTANREENDFYASPSIATEKLIDYLGKDFFTNKTIYEPACGNGGISNIISKIKNVHSSDIIDRGYGEVKDFFKINELSLDNNDSKKIIITNPPYSAASEFLLHSMELINDNDYVIMLLKIQFLESKKRKEIFKKFPPIRVLIFSERIGCAKNGDFSSMESSAVCYCWFVWCKGYKYLPTIDWI